MKQQSCKYDIFCKRLNKRGNRGEIAALFGKLVLLEGNGIGTVTANFNFDIGFFL
jgi:hypothetical protein